MRLSYYIVRRLGQAVLVVWAAYTVTFIILYALPGDPVSLMAGPEIQLSDEQLAALRAQYGLDQPIWVQYGNGLLGLVTGNLGTSFRSGKPVASAISEVLPATLQLAGASLLLAVVGGVALAIGASYTRSRWLRQGLLSLPPLATAIPGFWLGLVLLQVFSFRLGWLPAVGNIGAQSLILPAVTLAVPGAAILAQVLAKSLRNTLRQPFIEAARAKGLNRRTVLLKHALRNSALPALTVLGLMVAGVLTGAVGVETVFSRAGVGRLAQTATTAQDFPVVQGVVVLAAAVFATASLIVDLLYPLVDPRITTLSPRALSRKVAIV